MRRISLLLAVMVLVAGVSVQAQKKNGIQPTNPPIPKQLCVQDQDGHGGKLLGRRPQVKLGVGCVGYLLAPVSHTIALAQEHLVMVCEKHRTAELLMCNLMHEQIIYL